MNEILFFASILLYFALMLVSYYLFGKQGLFVWICFVIILANIEALKLVTFFGFSVTLGNVLYASSFLATDIISEKYGKEEANKTINMGFFALLVFIIFSQFVLMFSPDTGDFAHSAMATLFAMAPRLCLASIVTYIAMQKLDIFIFHKIRNKTGGKMLWLRNCGATMTCQLFDSIIFNCVAFYGVYDNSTLLSIILLPYLLKFIIAIFDTPFVYLAVKMTPRREY